MKQEEYRKTIEKAFPLRKELKQDMSRELFRTQNKKRGKKRYVISAHKWLSNKKVLKMRVKFPVVSCGSKL